jgi:1-acyl-sn-glycerol-3-phosphate acyltransferase
VRRGVRALIGATRTRLVVTGVEHLPPDQPFVVTANHASVLDALALVRVVPGAPRFVAASEFSRHAVLRMFLRRLGTEFVERVDRGQSIAGAHRLLELAREGESLVIFPEGRLSTVPGLRPFHLGAFAAAASVGCATVPVALAGTRSMLPPRRKLPRSGTIEVFIGVPMRAHGTGWHDVVKLRDDVRSVILAECREPDLEVVAQANVR